MPLLRRWTRVGRNVGDLLVGIGIELGRGDKGTVVRACGRGKGCVEVVVE